MGYIELHITQVVVDIYNKLWILQAALYPCQNENPVDCGRQDFHFVSLIFYYSVIMNNFDVGFANGI